MKNETKPGVIIKRVNLEYFKKLQEFVESKRSLEDFKIMYKTYYDVTPADNIIQNYHSQIHNLTVMEEEQESSYDDSYDDSY